MLALHIRSATASGTLSPDPLPSMSNTQTSGNKRPREETPDNVSPKSDPVRMRTPLGVVALQAIECIAEIQFLRVAGPKARGQAGRQEGEGSRG